MRGTGSLVSPGLLVPLVCKDYSHCCKNLSILRLYWDFPGSRWLGLRVSTAAVTGFLPDQGIKIPRASHCGQIKGKKNIVLWKVLMEGLRHLIDS